MLIDGRSPYSAADISDALQVSAAAVSGAAGVLVRGRFVVKERDPGSRIDQFRLVATDAWSVMSGMRADQLLTWHSSLVEAAQILGRRTSGGRRMHQAGQFVAFSRERLLASAQLWKERVD
jgi:DNA-binding transcriptional regulator GbsR (MarR family)